MLCCVIQLAKIRKHCWKLFSTFPSSSEINLWCLLVVILLILTLTQTYIGTRQNAWEHVLISYEINYMYQLPLNVYFLNLRFGKYHCSLFLTFLVLMFWFSANRYIPTCRDPGCLHPYIWHTDNFDSLIHS